MLAAAAKVPRARRAEFAGNDLVEVESSGRHPEHVEKKHEKGESKRNLCAKVNEEEEEEEEEESIDSIDCKEST